MKSSEDVIDKSTEEGLLSIVKACELRKDEMQYEVRDKIFWLQKYKCATIIHVEQVTNTRNLWSGFDQPLVIVTRNLML